MAYAVFAVANEFIKNRSLSNLSPMKIQKLVYYANLWYADATGEPIVDEPFCRWRFGPVIPSLYHQLKNYRSEAVTSPIRWANVDDKTARVSFYTPYVNPHDKKSMSCIKQVAEKYGIYTGTQLSNLSHRNGSAWSIRRGKNGEIENCHRETADGSVIALGDMKEEANKLRVEAKLDG